MTGLSDIEQLLAIEEIKQLKALKFRTPYEAVEELWKSKPDIFIVKPNHHMLGYIALCIALQQKW